MSLKSQDLKMPISLIYKKDLFNQLYNIVYPKMRTLCRTSVQLRSFRAPKKKRETKHELARL